MTEKKQTRNKPNEETKIRFTRLFLENESKFLTEDRVLNMNKSEAAELLAELDGESRPPADSFILTMSKSLNFKIANPAGGAIDKLRITVKELEEQAKTHEARIESLEDQAKTHEARIESLEEQLTKLMLQMNTGVRSVK